MAPIAHPKEDWEVCVYTDASQDYWGAIVTQVGPGELENPLSEQVHVPLAFISGSFKGAAARWAIVEKEAFVIVETCKRLEYILRRERGFHLFTNHRNLKFIFDPDSVDTNIARYKADKLQRWAMVLQTSRYVIEYVSGDENAWGDMLSRWGSPNQKTKQSTTKCYALAVEEKVSPLEDTAFEWPSLDEIKLVQSASQERSRLEIPKLTTDKERGVLVDTENRIWIPDSAVTIQQRLCIVVHAGSAGHRGVATTFQILSKHVTWSSMNRDVKEFVLRCLHCLSARGGRCPRPFGETLRATKPNEILHFDSLSMPAGSGGYRYVLVFKDGMSGFCEFIPSVVANTDVTVAAILDWFKRYGAVSVWVSDRGSDFKNEVISKLSKILRMKHHFVTAYCPWANGSFEVLIRQLLKIMRCLLSERKLRIAEWPSLLPLCQSSVNQLPSARLNGYAPVTGFTALLAGDPVSVLYRPAAWNNLDSMTALELTTKQQDSIQTLQDTLAHMHQALSEAAKQKNEAARRRHSRKKGRHMY